MNKKLIKKLTYSFFILFSFCSCDPGYCVAISNHTEYDKQVQVLSARDTLKIFENVKEKEFDIGKLVGKVPNNLSDNYLEVDILKGQILLIDSWIGQPSSKLHAIINNDTIHVDKFSCKRRLGGLLGRKYVYIIRD